MSVLSTARSRIADVVDLFASPLRASHYVELVNPLWSSHLLQARVEDVWDETADARTITLRPGRNWRRHRAGQHVRLGVPIRGRQYTRTYSISSSPERRDGCITVTVKMLDHGRMSGHLVRNLEVGTYLPLGLPQGDFVVPEAMPVRPLFITAGSGVTPVMSILRTWDIVGIMPDVAHIHYAPHRYDVLFGPELEILARTRSRYKYAPVFTRDPRPEQGTSRHFSAVQIEELCPDWREREIWACGPQSLLSAVEQHFDAAGRSHLLHVERFRAPLAKTRPDAIGGRVTFRTNSGAITAEADANTPLLRIAEDAGLNPKHGCRMGICHTCDAPLVAGKTRDLRTGEVFDEPGRAVQICVTATDGDCELDLTHISQKEPRR